MARVRRYFSYTDSNGKRRRLDMWRPSLHQRVIQERSLDLPYDIWPEMLAMRHETMEDVMGIAGAQFFSVAGVPSDKQQADARFYLNKMDVAIRILRKYGKQVNPSADSLLMAIGDEFWHWREKFERAIAEVGA